VPYFKWSGIRLDGTVVTGKSRALHSDELAQLLLQNDIGLMRVSMVSPHSIFRPIRASLKASCFRHLALLLDAGVFLNKALVITTKKNPNPVFKEVLEDIENSVNRGNSLADSFAMYPTVFDSLTVTLLQAGQHAGSLVIALNLLAEHIERVDLFYKKGRNALFLPILTGLFFVIIATLIFVMVVPTFAAMFNATGKQLPDTMSMLLAISNYMTLINGVLLFGMLIIVGLVARKLYRLSCVRSWLDAAIMHIPVIGPLSRNIMLLYFLQSLSLLTRQGVHMIVALKAIIPCIHNVYVHKRLEKVLHSFDQGLSLSEAFRLSGLLCSDTVHLIEIGQESSSLGLVLHKASLLYQERVDRMLHMIAAIAQPCLMLILGFLIVGLMIAIYMPLLNFSYVIA
jgi:type II secretory pathway component PulF